MARQATGTWEKSIEPHGIQGEFGQDLEGEQRCSRVYEHRLCCQGLREGENDSGFLLLDHTESQCSVLTKTAIDRDCQWELQDLIQTVVNLCIGLWS